MVDPLADTGAAEQRGIRRKSSRPKTCNSAGESTPSGAASVWIPSRPAAVIRPAISTGGVSGIAPVLTWTPDSLGIATAVVIERAPDGGEFVTVAVAAPDVPFMDEEALPPGRYSYRLFGRNVSL